MRSLSILERKGRSCLGGIRKSVHLSVAAMVMLSGIATPMVAVGGDVHTVNIYFGGTNLVSNDYLADESPFGAPALVALLHHCDDASEYDLQYKKFVDGKHYTGAFKSDHKHSKTKAAGTFLDGIMSGLGDDDTVILNIVGNSRGGVSGIYFASLVADGTWGKPNNERIVGINVIALDPVPGDQAWKPQFNNLDEKIGWDHFRLDKRITNYLGVYASDERSKLFAPVVPSHDQDWTRYLLVRLRGSHQTHVGSIKNFGHSPIGEVMCSDDEILNTWCLKGYQEETDLKSIGDIAYRAAFELLMSPEWGAVRFGGRSDAVCPITSPFSFHTMDPDNPPTLLEEDVAMMNDDAHLDYLYNFMRRTAFVPGIRPLSSWWNSDCKKWGVATTWKYNVPRCVVRVDGHKLDNCSKVSGVDVAVCPLHEQADMPLLGDTYSVPTFWTDLWEMGYLPPLGDADRDGYEDEQDNCPFTWNPDQLNTDGVGDFEGDACDPVADAYDSDGKDLDYYKAECTDQDATEIQLDGSGSVDPNGDYLTYKWEVGDQESTELKPLMSFKIGKNDILLTVRDPLNNSDEDTAEAWIVDTTFPVITGITEPIFRWPPNHKYKTFAIEDFVTGVEDICTPLTMDDLEIAGVTSSDGDDAAGDGNTSDDIVIAPDRNSVDLRIERSGEDKPRIYTIDIQVTDGSGNTSTESFEVVIGKQ